MMVDIPPSGSDTPEAQTDWRPRCACGGTLQRIDVGVLLDVVPAPSGMVMSGQSVRNNRLRGDREALPLTAMRMTQVGEGTQRPRPRIAVCSVDDHAMRSTSGRSLSSYLFRRILRRSRQAREIRVPLLLESDIKRDETLQHTPIRR